MKNYLDKEKNIRERDASKYDEWYKISKGELFDYVEKKFFSNFVIGKDVETIIDLGCGTGRITEVLAPFCKEISAVDFSQKSIDILEDKKICNVKVYNKDITSNIGFKNSYFDLAVSCETFQHLMVDDFLNSLIEVNRILKTESYLLFEIYNYWHFRNNRIFEILEHGLLFKMYTKEQLEYLAGKTGFELVGFHYFSSLPIRIQNKVPFKIGLIVERIISSLPIINKYLNRNLFVVFKKIKTL